MPNFSLSAGESCTILHIGVSEPGMATFVYRIAVTELRDCELKIIREGKSAVMMTANQKHKTVDVATSENLYLEAVGVHGNITGSYECVG